LDFTLALLYVSVICGGVGGKMGNNSSEFWNGGIGFAGLLTIVFIVLKLTDVIDWSWWWVLSPLWIGFIVGLLIIVLALLLLAGWLRVGRSG